MFDGLLAFGDLYERAREVRFESWWARVKGTTQRTEVVYESGKVGSLTEDGEEV